MGAVVSKPSVRRLPLSTRLSNVKFDSIDFEIVMKLSNITNGRWQEVNHLVQSIFSQSQIRYIYIFYSTIPESIEISLL